MYKAVNNNTLLQQIPFKQKPEPDYLLPNVFKLLYTFSYFFQASINFPCGDIKQGSKLASWLADTTDLQGFLGHAGGGGLPVVTACLTLKFSLVSHGSDYDNVHIPSVTMLTAHKKQQMHNNA